MRQLTLRVGDRLAARLKAVAAERGESVNAYAAAVLTAAVDPDLADGELERLRERLARAGVLAPGVAASRRRPPDADVAQARAAAGSGRSLSSLVSEERR
jgi:hypothetical protein